MFGNLLIFGGDSEVEVSHSRILARLMLRGKESSLCGKKRGNVTIHHFLGYLEISRRGRPVDIYASSRELGVRPRGPGQVQCMKDSDGKYLKTTIVTFFFAGPKPSDHIQHRVTDWVSQHKVSDQDNSRRPRLVLVRRR